MPWISFPDNEKNDKRTRLRHGSILLRELRYARTGRRHSLFQLRAPDTRRSNRDWTGSGTQRPCARRLHTLLPQLRRGSQLGRRPHLQPMRHNAIMHSALPGSGKAVLRLRRCSRAIQNCHVSGGSALRSVWGRRYSKYGFLPQLRPGICRDSRGNGIRGLLESCCCLHN